MLDFSVPESESEYIISRNSYWSICEICEEFGIEYGVQYNPTKTVCILYARKTPKEKPKISLNGTELK